MGADLQQGQHDGATAPAGDGIDIVYLWVDGSDPAWSARRRAAQAVQAAHPVQGKQKKQEQQEQEQQEQHEWEQQEHQRHQEQQELQWSQGTLGAAGALAPHGDVAGRYRDNGELRYNLRALQRFFPQHGHVYIVTDGQRPRWLNDHPGLTVIDHAALLPAQALPVFDSGHIESYLHHIPGLSERFLYLNDDVFFGAPVDPATWFSADGVALYLESATVPDCPGPQPYETSLVNASLLSRDWLAARDPGYRHRPQIFAHTPRPMLRSLMHELEAVAPELFAQVRSTVFRSWKVPPLVPDLVPRWMLHHGHAVVRGTDPLYISSGAADAASQFALLRKQFGSLPSFCINDTSDDAPPDAPALLRIATELASLLPTPSAFER